MTGTIHRDARVLTGFIVRGKTTCGSATLIPPICLLSMLGL